MGKKKSGNRKKSGGYDNDGGDDDDDYGFDSLESTLLGERSGGNFRNLGNSSNFDLDKKMNLSVRVQNDIVRSEKKSEKRANSKGKEARATIEQVMDPRTRLILSKLMGIGFLTQIDGCLSTGKEANVYYAKGENGKEYAVKIFKTSILVFKDRDKYVSGEYRFRHGYCRSNPRKMVKVWAEKEMRNLKRLQMAGLPSPAPHILKSHVLIMDFLGENGWCAPRLKDAQLSFPELHECYRVCVVMMRTLLHDCGLIHGDFSEYNLLYHQKQICVIDVSQSVEISHPLSLEFLRKDISNINDFFGRRGVYTLHKMDVFAFITADPAIDYKEDRELFPNAIAGLSEEEVNSLRRQHHWKKWRTHLDALILSQYREEQGVSENDVASQAVEQKREVEEAVFMRSFIPTRLDDIPNPMQEMKRLQSGQRENVFSSAISTMLAGSTIGAVAPVMLSNNLLRNDKGRPQGYNADDRDFVLENEYDDEDEEDDNNLAKLALYEEAEKLAAIEEGEEYNEEEDDSNDEDEELRQLINLLKTTSGPKEAIAANSIRDSNTSKNAFSEPVDVSSSYTPGSLVATVLTNVRNALNSNRPLPMSSSELLKKWKRPDSHHATEQVDIDENEAEDIPLKSVSAAQGNAQSPAEDDSEDDAEDGEAIEEDISESEEDDEENDDDDDDDEEYDERDEKYRRQLPSRDNPEERLKAKEARKEAAKAQKEAKKLKRQTNKIPKHVKKRATTRNKK